MSPASLSIARLWWTGTRRAWQGNAALLLVAAALSAAHGVHTLRGPAAAGNAADFVLFAAALGTALLLPVTLRTPNLLASPRIALLPLAPRRLHLLRVLLGNPFRLVLAASALAWGVVAVWRGDGSAASAAVAATGLAAWTAAGCFAADALEEALRRRPRFWLFLPVTPLLTLCIAALAGFGRLAPRLADWPSVPTGAATGVALGALLAAAAVGRMQAERYARTAPRPAPRAALATLPRRVGAAIAPRAPALLAKELGRVLRIAALRMAHGWSLGAALLAFAVGFPPLLTAAFLPWLLAAPNLLGPDVPLGGTKRYALLPRPLRRVLPAAHAAVVLAVAFWSAAAALVVGLAGGWKTPVAGWASSAAYPLWLAFGTGVFLLFTVAGDRISLAAPRAVGLHALSPGPGGGILTELVVLAALAVLVATAVATVFGWSMVAAATLPAGSVALRFPLALALATLTHLLLYGIHLAALARAR